MIKKGKLVFSIASLVMLIFAFLVNVTEVYSAENPKFVVEEYNSKNSSDWSIDKGSILEGSLKLQQQSGEKFVFNAIGTVLKEKDFSFDKDGDNNTLDFKLNTKDISIGSFSVTMYIGLESDDNFFIHHELNFKVTEKADSGSSSISTTTKVTSAKTSVEKEKVQAESKLNLEEVEGIVKTEFDFFGERKVTDIAADAVRIILGIVGSIALAMFVMGGFIYMTSAGNSEKSKKAVDILIWSSLGVIVILSSYAIVKLVFEIF